MALTQLEIDVLNQAQDRIGGAQIAFALQTDLASVRAIRHYEQTRDALLRSYEWPWASERVGLSQISTLTLDKMPTAAWAVGDTITGITSGTTATILTVTSETEYDIIYLSGDFTDGETITNADDVEILYWEGQPLTYEGETLYSYDDSDSEQVKCGTGYPVVAAKTPAYKWAYQYQLPDDFMRLREVYEDDGTDEVNYRWEIEGRKILTDYDTCNIKYVRKVTLPTDFDPLFTEVLILRLALKLINPTAGTKTNDIKADIKDDLRLAEAKAKIISLQENDTSGRANFNLARYGS